MRQILDKCLCGKGLLVPRGQQDAVAYHLRRKKDTVTPISHLACNACSLMYESAHAWISMEYLRKMAYAGKVAEKEQLITAVPPACEHCRSTDLRRERVDGPLGVPPELAYDRDFRDPREIVIGLYCESCNTVIGLLPPDPEDVQEFDRQMAAITKARK